MQVGMRCRAECKGDGVVVGRSRERRIGVVEEVGRVLGQEVVRFAVVRVGCVSGGQAQRLCC